MKLQPVEVSVNGKMVSKEEALQRLRHELDAVNARIETIKSDKKDLEIENNSEYEDDNDFEEDDDVNKVNDSGPSIVQKAKQQKKSSRPSMEELRELARSLSSNDIKEMLSSSLVQQAMAKLGIHIDDLLPERQARRLSMKLTDSIKEHLEKRRIEAICLVLSERYSLMEQLEQTKRRPSTTLSLVKRRLKNGDDVNDDINDDDAQHKRPSLSKDPNRAEERRKKILEWEKEMVKQRDLQRAELEERLKRRNENAERLRLEKQERMRVKLEQKMQANAQAKRVQAKLATRKKERWKRKLAKIERRVQEVKSTPNLLLLPSTTLSSAGQSSTDVHRLEVREEAKRREEERSARLLEQQRKKELQLEKAREKLDERIEEQKEKRRLAEIDRIIRLERLSRQSQYRRTMAEQKLHRKMESMDSLQEKLRKQVGLQQQQNRMKLESLSSPYRENPGPGSYELGSTLTKRAFNMGSPSKNSSERLRIDPEAFHRPGPGDYDIGDGMDRQLRPGASFTKGKIMSEFDWISKRAESIPGPDAYYNNGNSTCNNTGPSLGRPENEDLKRVRAMNVQATPGPGHYNLP